MTRAILSSDRQILDTVPDRYVIGIVGPDSETIFYDGDPVATAPKPSDPGDSWILSEHFAPCIRGDMTRGDVELSEKLDKWAIADVVKNDGKTVYLDHGGNISTGKPAPAASWADLMLDSEFVSVWLRAAENHGIILTAAEMRLPKPELIELIRERARE